MVVKFFIFGKIVPNMYIILTTSDLSPQNWVDMSDKGHGLFIIKYIIINL
jgi:hypothetical protein